MAGDFVYKKHQWKKHCERRKRAGARETKQRKFIKNQLINKTGGICAICGKPITNMKDATIDHIKPVSKGGATTIENCQLAHFWCNQEKGDEYDEEAYI